MALEATFRELAKNVQALRDALHQLIVTFDDRPPDRPHRQPPYLVGPLHDALVALMSLGDEAVEEVHKAYRAVGHPTDLELARRALVRCQECIHRLAKELADEPLSRKRLAELRAFADRQGGEWPGWLECIKVGLKEGRQQIDEVNKTLFRSWEEFAERMGTSSVSVQTTSVGQVYLPGRETVERPV